MWFMEIPDSDAGVLERTEKEEGRVCDH